MWDQILNIVIIVIVLYLLLNLFKSMTKSQENYANWLESGGLSWGAKRYSKHSKGLQNDRDDHNEGAVGENGCKSSCDLYNACAGYSMSGDKCTLKRNINYNEPLDDAWGVSTYIKQY